MSDEDLAPGVRKRVSNLIAALDQQPAGADEDAPGGSEAYRRLDRDDRIVQSLHSLHRKVDTLMADISALTNAVNALDTDEQAAAADLQALTNTIAGLQAGQVTQAQIDELTTHATAVATALSSATAANKPAPAPAPPGPDPTPGPAPSPAARSVYTVDAGATVDTRAWTATTEQTADVPPKPLYNFAGDTAPGDRKGDGLGGVWHLYTGQVQPVPGPAPGPAPVPPAPAG